MLNSSNNPKHADSKAWNQAANDFCFYDKAPICANNPYAKLYLNSSKDSNKLVTPDNYDKGLNTQEIP